VECRAAVFHGLCIFPDHLRKTANLGILGVSVPNSLFFSLQSRKTPMPVEPTPASGRTEATDLAKAVQPFTRPDFKKAIWQVVNTFVPFLALWALMVVMARQGFPYWSILAVSLVTAGFQVRLFIMFHDCCHGSFFSTPRANRILGYITGILTFTPFEQWRRSHAMHHDTVGDLDRRGIGDIWTLTVEEFEAAPRWKRLVYRIIRNPLFILSFGTPIIFLIGQRFFHKLDRKRERWSVVVTNGALAAILTIAGVTVGIGTYLLIQMPVAMISGAAGLWLFYVQHQFQETYWERHKNWEPLKAALEGSSFYKLPGVLKWFTGNIGFHHVHHVQQRIPNYNLERCHNELPALREVRPLTLFASLRCAWLHVWDEKSRRLTGYGGSTGQ
jgi:omega-6 fatty acid desaturase (delta-12 desaturase)